MMKGPTPTSALPDQNLPDQKKNFATQQQMTPNAAAVTMATIQRLHSDPTSLTPAEMPGLQRRIGNAAVANALGRNRPTQTPTKAPLTRTNAQIQRYPANVFQEPGVNWGGETKQVKKSGEGVSGGVYFFKGKSGPVNNVVVKPEFAAQADETSFPDQFIKSMGGIKVPDARLISPKAPEATEILDTARALGSEIPTTMTERSLIGDAEEKDLLYFKVMATAEGSSVSSDAHKVSTPGGVNDLIARLGKKEILSNVGRLVAFDGFMGNRDRIGKMKANLGNIMYNGTAITAIDSGAELKKYGAKIQSHTNVDIENLFSEKGPLINQFIDGIAYAIEAEEQKEDPHTTFEAATHFRSYYNLPLWRTWIGAGIDQGILDIEQLFSARKNKGARKELKESALDWQERGGQKINWERIKMSHTYLRSRLGGRNEDEAKGDAQLYANYRTKRAAMPKGLKWMSKLNYLRKKRFGR